MPRPGPTRHRRATVALVAFLACAASSLSAQSPSEQLLRRGPELAYNLDHDEAIATMRSAVGAAPEDPRTHRALASVLWLDMLFRRGAVTVDHYLGSFNKAKVDLKKPPPELEAEFKRHLRKAVELARRRAAARPGDPQAQYDLGAALGLEASYVASVEGRLLAGLNAARHAYNAHERVLELDPSRRDSGVIVGTYRYIVSTLPLAMRWMAYIVGFGGGKARGIELIEQTAASETDSRPDAMFALTLIYNRERRYDDALRSLAGLRRLFPRNRLVVLESGATMLRAGRPQQAEETLTAGLAALARDSRRRVPGEEGLWRYKRGAARVVLGKLDAASEDLRAALDGEAPQWVSGRARVELARIALKRGNGPDAATQARQAERLCRQSNDPVCVDDAKRLLRSVHGR